MTSAKFQKTYFVRNYLLFTFIFVTGLIGGMLLIQYKNEFLQTLSFRKSSNLHPAECKLYGIHENEDDSQLVTIDPKTQTITPLGPKFVQFEFENIVVHPESNILYVNSSNDGKIYAIDALTGAKSLATQAHTELSAFTFHPFDYSTWGWAKSTGLVELNSDSDSDDLMFHSLKRGSALTWNNEGNLMYIAFKDDSELLGYDPARDELKEVADNLPLATRGFLMLNNGLILGTNTESKNALHIYTYNPITKKVATSIDIETPYFETRGIAWPKRCGDPFAK